MTNSRTLTKTFGVMVLLLLSLCIIAGPASAALGDGNVIITIGEASLSIDDVLNGKSVDIPVYLYYSNGGVDNEIFYSMNVAGNTSLVNGYATVKAAKASRQPLYDDDEERNPLYLNLGNFAQGSVTVDAADDGWDLFRTKFIGADANPAAKYPGINFFNYTVTPTAAAAGLVSIPVNVSYYGVKFASPWTTTGSASDIVPIPDAQVTIHNGTVKIIQPPTTVTFTADPTGTITPAPAVTTGKANISAGDTVFTEFEGTDPVPASSLVPAAEGYTFRGWYNETNADSGTAVMVVNNTGILKEAAGYVNAAGEWIKTDAPDHKLTLYGAWTPGYSNLTFNPLEGTCSVTEGKIFYNEEVVKDKATGTSVIPSASLVATKDHYEFCGWNVSGTDIIVIDENGQLVSGDAGIYVKDGRWNCTVDLTLDAKWCPVLTLNLNPNNGSTAYTGTIRFEGTIASSAVTLDPVYETFKADEWRETASGIALIRPDGTLIVNEETIPWISSEGKWTNLSEPFYLTAHYLPNLTYAGLDDNATVIENPDGSFTIKLDDDVAGPVKIPDTWDNTTLDLNGHTIKGADGTTTPGDEDGKPGIILTDEGGTGTNLTIANGGEILGGSGADGTIPGDGGAGIKSETDASENKLTTESPTAVKGGNGGESTDPTVPGGNGGNGIDGQIENGVTINGGEVSGGNGGNGADGTGAADGSAGGNGGSGIAASTSLVNGTVINNADVAGGNGGNGGSSENGDAGLGGAGGNGSTASPLEMNGGSLSGGAGGDGGSASESGNAGTGGAGGDGSAGDYTTVNDGSVSGGNGGNGGDSVNGTAGTGGDAGNGSSGHDTLINNGELSGGDGGDGGSAAGDGNAGTGGAGGDGTTSVDTLVNNGSVSGGDGGNGGDSVNGTAGTGGDAGDGSSGENITVNDGELSGGNGGSGGSATGTGNAGDGGAGGSGSSGAGETTINGGESTGGNGGSGGNSNDGAAGDGGSGGAGSSAASTIIGDGDVAGGNGGTGGSSNGAGDAGNGGNGGAGSSDAGTTRTGDGISTGGNGGNGGDSKSGESGDGGAGGSGTANTPALPGSVGGDGGNGGYTESGELGSGGSGGNGETLGESGNPGCPTGFEISKNQDGSYNLDLVDKSQVNVPVTLPDSMGNVTMNLNGETLKGLDGTSDSIDGKPAVQLNNTGGTGTNLTITNGKLIGGSGYGSDTGADTPGNGGAAVQVNSPTGSLTIGPDVEITGGNGGDSTNPSNPGGNGGNAVNGTINDGVIINDSKVSGGNGGNGADGTGAADGSAGGNGGSGIAAAGTEGAEINNADVSGGNGGNGGNSENGNAGAGGNAGDGSSAAPVTVTNSNLSGGDGGNGGNATGTGNAGNGGDAGDGSTGNDTTINSGSNVSGGNGGNGGDSTDGDAGNGGNAGDGTSGDQTEVNGGNVSGGDGGNGGNATGTGNAGNGGDAGDGSSGDDTAINDGSSTGGNGGSGGNSVDGAAGDGGSGGAGSSGDSTTIGDGDVAGGNGGTGGSSTGAGDAGDGGNGGAGSSDAGTTRTGDGISTGGNGGNGGDAANGDAGNGGNGGNGTENTTALPGSTGGDGGNGGTSAEAAGGNGGNGGNGETGGDGGNGGNADNGDGGNGGNGGNATSGNGGNGGVGGDGAAGGDGGSGGSSDSGDAGNGGNGGNAANGDAGDGGNGGASESGNGGTGGNGGDASNGNGGDAGNGGNSNSGDAGNGGAGGSSVSGGDGGNGGNGGNSNTGNDGNGGNGGAAPAGNTPGTGGTGKESGKVNYWINYLASGSTIPAQNIAAANDSVVTVGYGITVPSKSGFTFAGWTTSDVTVSANQFTMPNSNVNFKASWNSIAPAPTQTARIISTGGGGSGGGDSGSGHYTQYDRQMSKTDSVSFGSSPLVESITFSEPVSGQVTLNYDTKGITDTVRTSVDAATGEIKTAGQKNAPVLVMAKTGGEVKFVDVFTIDGSAKLPTEKVKTISFKIPLSTLKNQGFTENDVILYHGDEKAEVWIPCDTYLESTDKTYAYYHADTNGASPFAVVFMEDKTIVSGQTQTQTSDPVMVQTQVPVSSVTSNPTSVPTAFPTAAETAAASPMPLAGLLAGLGITGLILGARRS